VFQNSEKIFFISSLFSMTAIPHVHLSLAMVKPSWLSLTSTRCLWKHSPLIRARYCLGRRGTSPITWSV